MTVTREDVRHIASLARLELSEEEVDRFTRQLDAILGHAADLATADRGDAPTSPSEQRTMPLAGDAPGSDALRLPVEALSPAFRDGFFTVPRLPAMQDPDGAPDETP